MKIAIVIKLDKKSEKKIKNLKNFFKEKHSKCLYVDDFPHITLLTAKVKLNLNELCKIDLNINSKPIKIDISKPKTFSEDLLTGGKTFFFRVEKNKKLLDLQVNISNFFRKYLQKIEINEIFKKSSKEYKSLKRYGFPYVGKHWIPHVSICSVLDSEINQKVYKKFIDSKVNFIFYINAFSICTVNQNVLKKIKTIKFIN